MQELFWQLKPFCRPVPRPPCRHTQHSTAATRHQGSSTTKGTATGMAQRRLQQSYAHVWHTCCSCSKVQPVACIDGNRQYCTAALTKCHRWNQQAGPYCAMWTLQLARTHQKLYQPLLSSNSVCTCSSVGWPAIAPGLVHVSAPVAAANTTASLRVRGLASTRSRPPASSSCRQTKTQTNEEMAKVWFTLQQAYGGQGHQSQAEVRE